MTLAQTNTDQPVQVLEMDLDAATRLRLQALGMIKHTIVKVLQKKGNGTLIIDLRGTRFALGSQISNKIEVAYA